MSKYRSIIWKVDKEVLIELVRKSKSFVEILNHFGLENKGNNYKTLKARLEYDQIDYAHIFVKVYCKETMSFDRKWSLGQILQENSPIKIHKSIKKRIVDEKLLDDTICAICHQTNCWENKKLVLILDHINGQNTDNRIENLRFICPNCNSQTNTFAGKNKLYKQKRHNCINCGKLIKQNKSCQCYICHRKTEKLDRRKVVNRPTLQEIQEMLTRMSWSEIGRKYGVSCNAVRKWVKSYNCSTKI